MSKRTPGSWSWVLAETGIVVVGILIAFSLNSWWEGRTAAAQERAHLSSLHTDFEQNVERLDALAVAQDRVSGASGDLLLIARDRAAVPPDSIDGLIGEVFSSDQFDPVMGAYENLVNSGGLAQVRDDSLRSALASFAAMVDSRYAEEFSTALYLDFNREFMGRLGWAGRVIGSLPGHEEGRPEGPGESWNQRLLDDPAFQDHLAFRFLTQRDVAEMYRDLAAQARVVLNRTRTLIR